MRVLVCGGRNYDNRASMANEFYNLLDRAQDITILHGAAPGADSLAHEFAHTLGFGIRRFPAEWDKYGPAAGPIRNQRMLDEGKPDVVLAFPGGKGTADMVARAKNAGVRVIEVPA